MEVLSPEEAFYEEGARPLVPDRRREGFPDRYKRPIMAASRAPSRLHAFRSPVALEDVPGRDQGPPVPRGRAAELRYSVDLRPALWLQVHVMNIQPSSPELAKPTGPSFHSMIPRRDPDFIPATSAARWNPCFACGQTGHRLMNCHGTRYFIRSGPPLPRWYRRELVVGPAGAAAPVIPNSAAPGAATPALPAPPDPTPAAAPTAPGLTRRVDQLTWTPSVIVMEPGVSQLIVSIGLHSTTSAARNDNPTTGSQQSRPELAAPSRPEEASAKGGTETGAVPMITASDTGCNGDARAPAVRRMTAD